MNYPPGGSAGSGFPPGGYPAGYDQYSSPLPQGQPHSGRYPPNSTAVYSPHSAQRVDAYGRVIVAAAVPPPPPPPPQGHHLSHAMYPTSAPPAAGYNVYPRPAAAAFAAQQMYPTSPNYHHQPHLTAGGYATQPPPPPHAVVAPPANPYSGMPAAAAAYGYPQSAPPLAGQYAGSNPYDPYGTAFNAAMARSYQEGFESRDHRGRRRGEPFYSIKRKSSSGTKKREKKERKEK